MSIHLIELIDIKIGQTLPLTGLIGSPCFFRGFFIRYIIYQLSTRRLWPALSLLWGSFTSSPGRPTIIYRSTWWSLDGEVSIYHYREAKPSLSCLHSFLVLPPLSTCKKTLLSVSQHRSCSAFDALPQEAVVDCMWNYSLKEYFLFVCGYCFSRACKAKTFPNASEIVSVCLPRRLLWWRFDDTNKHAMQK